jgi:general secretion pathway protein D
MAALNDTLNKSKVLVFSEVYTPNGIKAQISNVKSVPTFATDSSGNVQTQYQNLETSISVVPTIIKYNADKPQESLVRVDVDVKVSIVSDTETFRNYSAPEYSAKTMSTTRILTADNQSNVIGTFITDSDIKTVSGVPILGKLPLLRYLFSKENKEKMRNTAVLTLSVMNVPMTLLWLSAASILVVDMVLALYSGAE